MSTKESPTNNHDHVHQEHVHLRHVVDSILETIVGRAASFHVIAEMFSELTEHVLDHFRHEEADGYFAEAVERAPRLRERADELLSQHPIMAAQLDELQVHLNRPASTENWWKDLEGLFRHFLCGFNEHEAGENDLLQLAYCVDIAAED